MKTGPDPHRREAGAAHRPVVALAATAILIIGTAVFFAFPSLRIHLTTARSASNPARSDKSIAVLPFENLSADPDNAFFADGVQDDILTKLATISDLKVISRISVTHYRGKQDLREVRKALGVSHVLEGTVRRSGGKVHVNARLLDTRTNAHLWAQDYDGRLNEVFAIEAEVAQATAKRLGANVSGLEQMAIQEQPTSDLVAYDLYLRAGLLIEESLYYGLSSETNLFKAVELLNQAIARDPAFLLAYCQLARAHDGIYWTNLDHAPGRLELAQSAINSASRQNPDSGEVHLASALHFYYGYLDYDRARDELNIALRSMPNNARIFEPNEYIDRTQGRWHEAVRNLGRAVQLDPGNGDVLFGAGVTYLCARDYKRARERSLIAPSPSPQRTTSHGYSLLGLSSMNGPIPDHGTLLWKKFSLTIHQGREIWHADASLWVCNEAIEQLERLAKLPAGVSYGEIRLDPFWDPLRGESRFEQIVSSLAPK